MTKPLSAGTADPPAAASAVRILIADDHAIFRDGLRKLLEPEAGFVVVGEASDGRTSIEQVRTLEPDILLLDISMPGMSGLDALESISRLGGRTRTLLLTAAIEKPELIRALQLGARGVVLKDAATAVLLKGIRGVMAGQYWIAHERVSTIVDALRLLVKTPPPAPTSSFGLSDRELQIVSAVVAGLSNREIAERLSISDKTVKHHLTNVFGKLGVSSRLELAMFALHHQLELPDLGPER